MKTLARHPGWILAIAALAAYPSSGAPAQGAEKGPAMAWPPGDYHGRYLCAAMGALSSDNPPLGNLMFVGSSQKRETAESLGKLFAAAEKAGMPLVLAGGHGARLVFPPRDSQSAADAWRFCLTPADYALLKQRFPKTFWAVRQAEIGGCAADTLAACPKPANRLEAMDNFIRNFAAINAPIQAAGSRIIIYDDFGFSPAYQLAAGCDLFIPELYRGQNMEWYLSQARGCARSVGKDWGGSLADHWWYTTYIYGERDQRPKNPQRRDTIDSLTPKQRREPCPNHSPEDLRHAYHYMFYQGCKILMSESRSFFDKQGQLTALGRVVRDFQAFLQKHPAIEAPLAEVAVVRGLGEGWQSCYAYDVRSASLKSRRDAFACGEPPMTDWAPNARYRDWELLNLFFPDFGDWALSTRYYTGTPHGQIDIISALAPADGLARYRLLFFLGVNVMTPELREKLKTYVDQGGILVMNGQQLRDVAGRLDALAAKDLFGVQLVSDELPKDKWLVRHRSGRGQALLTTTCWHWTAPRDEFRAVLDEALAGLGRHLALSPHNAHIETFVCPMQQGAFSLCFFNHQDVHRRRPYYRELYPVRETAVPAVAGKRIPFGPAEERKAASFVFPPQDFTAADEIKIAFHAEGPRPGGTGTLVFVDRHGRRAGRKGVIFRPFLCQRREGRDGMIEGVYEKYLSIRDFSEWISRDKIDWTAVTQMEITLLREEPGESLDFALCLDDLRLVDTLINAPRKTVARTITPYAGTASVNLAKLGLSDVRDLRIYRLNEEVQPHEVSVNRNGDRMDFDLDLRGEWQEYILARPTAVPMLFPTDTDGHRTP